MGKNVQRFVFGILGVLVFFNILAWIAVFDFAHYKFLEVTFFDVGQGDAIFIETPQSQQILIDGGPSSVILEKLSKEMPFWDKSIDLVILTHPERDHLGGLIEVLKKYKVENVLWTGVVRDTAEYKEWVKLIEGKKANVFIAKGSEKIKVSGTILDVLYPFENLEGKEFKNSNDTSIVNRLVFGQDFFLFTGDISKSTEKKLIEKQIDINSNILKVAHHGSKTSSSEEFINKVSPRLAIISVGENNSYGHPQPETLEILNKFGIKVLRTDLNGDIKIISNGINYAISNF